jgi:hypothetical protein
MQLQCEGWDGYKCYEIIERERKSLWSRCNRCHKYRGLMEAKKRRMMTKYRGLSTVSSLYVVLDV